MFSEFGIFPCLTKLFHLAVMIISRLGLTVKRFCRILFNYSHRNNRAPETNRQLEIENDLI